jgi:ABC-type transport system involved in multi-copper enzyme maturation permease subunit
MKNVFTIAKKEWSTARNGLPYYIVLAVFVLLWEGLFFRNAFVIGESSLRGMWDLLPWLLVVLIPAVTMGSFALEKESGTLELVLTHPVAEWQLVLGKFLGAIGVPVVGIAFSLPVAISFAFFGEIDWGVWVGQMVGGLGMVCVLAAIGVYISGKFSNQIAALLVSVAVSFVLVIGGSEFVTGALPIEVAAVISRVAIISHFQALARGVLDISDVWYFTSASCAFLGLAMLELMARKYGNRKKQFATISLGVWMFVGIAVISNGLGDRIRWRIDLTKHKIYTLSQFTRETLKSLPDVVNITLYSSSRLPAQYTPVMRDTKDILNDYKTGSGGQVVVSVKDPSDNQELAQEAESQGVRQVQFNVIGKEEFQLKTGYMGVVVSYAGKHETIPFLQRTDDLEYQLTSFIKKLTTTDKKKVTFLTANGEKELYSNFQNLNNELTKQFDTGSTSNLDEATQSAVLVIAGPSKKFDEAAVAKIKNLTEEGVGLLLLGDTYEVSPQVLTAMPKSDYGNELAKVFGVNIDNNVVYDLQANETVRFAGNNGMDYYLPYPFWVRAKVEEAGMKLMANISQVLVPWGGSVQIDEKRVEEMGLRAEKILTTTTNAGQKTGAFGLTPDAQTFDKNSLAQTNLGVYLEAKQDKHTKAVIMGNSLWLTDEFTQSAPENLAAGVGLVAYLSGEEGLAQIKAKTVGSYKLVFDNSTQAGVVKYGNLALAVVVPAVTAGLVITRRRKLRKYA